MTKRRNSTRSKAQRAPRRAAKRKPTARGSRTVAQTPIPSANGAPIDPMTILVDTHARITRLITGLEGDDDPQSYKTIARMSETLVKVSAEARQLSRQKRRDLASYTVDELVAHVKTLDERKRALFLDQVVADDPDEDEVDDEDDEDDVAEAA